MLNLNLDRHTNVITAALMFVLAFCFFEAALICTAVVLALDCHRYYTADGFKFPVTQKKKHVASVAALIVGGILAILLSTPSL